MRALALVVMEPSSDEDEDALCVVIDAAPPAKRPKPSAFACAECGKTYGRKHHLTQHIQVKHSANTPSFACDECGKTYTEKRQLTRHIKTQHSANPPSFACDECGKTFKEKSALNTHIKIQHSATPPSFACVQCDKTFAYKFNLKQHLAFAHDVGVMWHYCDADPDCDYKAKNGSNLAQHIRRMHARVFAQRKQEQEEHVRRALLDGGWQEYKLAETMPAVGFFRREKRIDFNCAKKAQPGALANAKQFAKIDFVLGVPDGYVFLEVDEHQHRFGYDNESLSCDMKRMASVQESLAIESGFELPNLYWLRYNPHAHRANGDLVKVPKAEREARLLAWLKAFAFAAPFGIGYAFYDYDDDDGLEVLNHPEYDTQYAALARNLKALEAGSSA